MNYFISQLRRIPISRIAIALLFISCDISTKRGGTKEYLTAATLSMMKPEIEKAIKEFIDSSKECNECVYEMVVDKKDDNQTTIGLRAYESPMSVFPDLSINYIYLNQINVGGKSFNVYSGLEELFTNKAQTNNKTRATNYVDGFYISWCLMICRDSIGNENISFDKIGCPEFISLHRHAPVIYH